MPTPENIKMEEAFRRRIQFIYKNEQQKTSGMVQPRLVSCDAANRTVVYEFPVLDWELNVKGVLHGGVMTILFDMSLGLLANYYSPGFCPTANIDIHFLKPALPKDSVLLTAKITSVGKRLITGYGEARLKSSGEMAANGLATFAATSTPNCFDMK